MRTTINLPAEQLHALKLLCERERISRAEAVRRAVELLLQTEADASINAAFGAWADRRVDGLEYQEKLRVDWPE